MHITIICIPYQIDVARWGCALGPQAFLDHGLLEQLQAKGHTISNPIWIELPKSERTRDSVTNLGCIAKRTSAAVSEALKQEDSFVLVLEGDCTHAVGAIGGLAQAKGSPGVVWFDAHGDLNTMETTTSGFLGGLPYAVALGWDLDDWRLAAGLEQPVRSEAAALIGASDLDPAEIEALELHPILRMDEALAPQFLQGQGRWPQSMLPPPIEQAAPNRQLVSNHRDPSRALQHRVIHPGSRSSLSPLCSGLHAHRTRRLLATLSPEQVLRLRPRRGCNHLRVPAQNCLRV